MSLIDVGYARRAHGTGGEVVVRPLTDDPDRWVVGASFVTNETPSRTLEVSEIRPHRGDLLVRFAGVDDRDAAEALRSVVFHIRASERRRLGDGEFWPDQLVGATVVGPDSSRLGIVVDIELAEAQDRLVIETADGSLVEVPFVTAIVPAVDVEAGVINLTPPEGIF